MIFVILERKEKEMRQTILAVTLSLLAFGSVPAARANETSELRQQILKQSRQLEELQQRLDELEANQKQQSEQMEKEISEAVKDKQLGALPEGLKWAGKVKISGDLRYRHEHTDEEDGSNPGRWENGLDRERIRARLLFEAIVNDEWDVAFRIASGNDRSPISANQDLEDAFSQKYFWLDLAYFDWHPASAEGLNIGGGKIKNPFYTVGRNQLIWDVDLNPEGIAARFHKPLSNGDQLFVNGGGFWVDESGSGVDTSLWGAQTYIKRDMDNSDYLLGGASYLDYGNLEGRTQLNSTWGGTPSFFGNTSSGGVYRDDYDIFEAFGEYGFKCSGRPMAVFASWVRNVVATTSEDTGWLIGGKLNKAVEPGSWEFSYDYRELDADAVVGGFTESDFIDGATNVRGHKFGFKYQLAKNVQSSFNYYHLENTSSARDLDYRKVLADLILKF